MDQCPTSPECRSRRNRNDSSAVLSSAWRHWHIRAARTWCRGNCTPPATHASTLCSILRYLTCRFQPRISMLISEQIDRAASSWQWIWQWNERFSTLSRLSGEARALSETTLVTQRHLWPRDLDLNDYPRWTKILCDPLRNPDARPTPQSKENEKYIHK